MMYQEIYVIDEDEQLTQELREVFKQKENLKFKTISINNIELIFRNLPQLIIINDDSINTDCIELCEKIRENEENNIIPIIVLSSR